MQSETCTDLTCARCKGHVHLDVGLGVKIVRATAIVEQQPFIFYYCIQCGEEFGHTPWEHDWRILGNGDVDINISQVSPSE